MEGFPQVGFLKNFITSANIEWDCSNGKITAHLDVNTQCDIKALTKL